MMRRVLQTFWPVGILLLVAAVRMAGCGKAEPAGAKLPTPRTPRIESDFTPPPSPPPVTWPPGVPPPAPTFSG
ncbi:MAG: hypothetical protein WEB59_16365 [Thermoanaerobaculia bacterium]